MVREFKRTDRIATALLRKLAQLIQQEISGPSMNGFVTLSAVTVSKDLEHAKVYFTVFNDDPAHMAHVLNTAASHLRNLLAHSMTMRTVPQLHFIYDESIEYGNRLSRLIDDVNPSNDNDEQTSD